MLEYKAEHANLWPRGPGPGQDTLVFTGGPDTGFHYRDTDQPRHRQIASAGRLQTAFLDETGHDWKKRQVTAGQNLDITWAFSAPHKTRSFNSTGVLAGCCSSGRGPDAWFARCDAVSGRVGCPALGGVPRLRQEVPAVGSRHPRSAPPTGPRRGRSRPPRRRPRGRSGRGPQR
ncbi:lytic polysaccharide monooxygenase [Kitasatospora sp. KL5]|uniref:lytic polysaccharide monooxygenase n=1 Tax=Kitasatospora sp. KL5 TaxID=3425125 RepID=UPI003D6F802D